MVAYDTVRCAGRSKERGYNLDFNIAFDKIQCAQNGYAKSANLRSWIFSAEGETDPSDQAIVYAIESKDHQPKVYW
jgi:hypothetical protein